MAALPVSESRISSSKRISTVRKNAALAFIERIDSTWKGHETFALWLVERLRPKTVVDLGFDRGLSTVAFAYKNKGHVFGIDWFDNANYSRKCFALDSAFQTISNALRFQYAKNIHLIVGPFQEIAQKWNRKIDILHIDGVHSYMSTKQHYDNWSRFLSEEGVILIHDVLSFPNETGRFFRELDLFKVIFPHAQGLGVACRNGELIEEIKKRFSLGVIKE